MYNKEQALKKKNKNYEIKQLSYILLTVTTDKEQQKTNL